MSDKHQQSPASNTEHHHCKRIAMQDLQTKGVSRIDKLAQMLHEDIQRRKLSVGDHYLTAAEASRMLGVSPVMANRAMNVLADRRLLTRHRRRGTFIGPDFRPNTPPQALRVIHIFKGLIKDEKKWTAVIGDCLQGLHAVLPGYQVQSNILPHHNPANMVRQIFNRHTSDGSLSGIILLNCPREVQEIVQELIREHRLPAVSFGMVHSNITRIPSLDHDQFESGRLQAKFLTDRGHCRILLLMQEHWLPGDNLLVDGIIQTLADVGSSHGVLTTRSIPEDVAIIKTEITRLLSIDDRPTGMICRSPLFAETAAEVARSRSMRVPEDLDIILHANGRHFSAELGLPRTSAKYSSRKQLTMVAETLKKIIDGKQIENNHIILPVELVGPEQRE